MAVWVATSVAVVVVHAFGTHGTAWHFFHDAARLLLGDDAIPGASGLALYRDHPEFQFGPPGILVAVPISGLGIEVGMWFAIILASAAGVVVVVALVDLLEVVRPGWRDEVPPFTLGGIGVLLVILWGDVAVRTAHIDDAIALGALVAAMHAVATNRVRSTIGWLALAAAAKPWAVMLAPLAAVGAPTGMKALARTAGVGLGALAVWSPFLVAEPATWDTRGFGIDNDPTSVLRALGVHDPTTPGWVRPVQLIGGMALVAVLVVARRWPAALLGALAWRLVVEPGAHRYYTVGIVLGAVIVEMLARPRRIPWAGVVLAVSLEVTALPGMPGVPGRWWRAAVVFAALVAAVVSRPVTDHEGQRRRRRRGEVVA